ncbi:hypothetical protein C7443_103432 [Plasticicumulans acidivorans]|uniref:Uncharacterized protein n=1 Tax=Plasticicumulans acidivorans TaxID=886464 RepID=A0A317MXG4_9GAMM|nr:hypothetical protein C7443_103432 [Plasticicumulans acidivorans]
MSEQSSRPRRSPPLAALPKPGKLAGFPAQSGAPILP